MDITLGTASVYSPVGSAQRDGRSAAALSSKSKEKLLEQRREMEIRKDEEKRLEVLREQITEIEATSFSSDLETDNKIKQAKISEVNGQIKQIEDARALREQEKLRREIEEQEQKAEEQRQEAEKKRQEAAPDRGGEEAAISHSDISGMVKLSVSHDAVNELNRTKAAMASEKTMLEQAVENSFGVAKYGAIADGHMTPGDFRHAQISKLGKGISGLESAISAEVRKMNEAAGEYADDKTREAAENAGTADDITVGDGGRGKNETERADESRGAESAAKTAETAEAAKPTDAKNPTDAENPADAKNPANVKNPTDANPSDAKNRPQNFRFQPY